MIVLVLLCALLQLACLQIDAYYVGPRIYQGRLTIAKAQLNCQENVQQPHPMQFIPVIPPMPTQSTPRPKFVTNAIKALPISMAGLAAASLLGSLVLGHPLAAGASTGLVEPITTAADQGFLQSYLLIFISEIGDKTFFIAALLAAKYGRLVSFTGSMGALIAMTVISTVIGQLFHAVPSSLTQGIPFDDYLAVAAFTYFGIKTLVDASKLQADEKSSIEEEKEEAEELVNEVTAKQRRSSAIALIVQTFSLVFAAEIGDRSFLSTIALSAALNPYAVAAGAVAAHGTATGVAVIGGSLMSKFLSEKVIGYIGGSLFLVFAVTTALGLF